MIGFVPERSIYPKNRDLILGNIGEFIGTSENMIEIGKNIIDPKLNHYKSKSSRPLISIVMLTYNALEYTKKCLQSILNFTQYPYEIIFVDNSSSDGTLEYLRDLVDNNDNFLLIQNNTNNRR